MPIVDVIVALTVAAVCGLAAGLVIESLWRRVRCPDCGTRAVPVDADALAPGVPVVFIAYRCPDCRRIIHRRCIGVWD